MIKLFELGDNYLVDLNKDWISTITEFKEILKRDRGSKGDVQGRAKLQATKEFLYIYHMVDFRSPYENFPVSERKERALADSGISEEEATDELLLTALTKYKLLLENSSPTLRLLRAVKTSMLPLEQYFETFSPVEPSDIKDHIANIKNMPALQKALVEFEDQVKLESLDEGAIRGQAEKGWKEDPDN